MARDPAPVASTAGSLQGTGPDLSAPLSICEDFGNPCSRATVWSGQGPARFRVTSPSPQSSAGDLGNPGNAAGLAVPPRDSDLTDLLKAPRNIQPQIDTETLIAKFAEMDASLELVRAGKAEVPRIFLARLPSDLRDVRSPATRKAAFIKVVLPLVLRANQDVLQTRKRLVAIQQVRRLGFDAGPQARRFLRRVAEEYETAPDDLVTLLKRVDIVPPSLALAQAAEESGWGTSRFARRGNAVFGQRTFKAGRGMVPLDREEGERHEVLAFESLQTSVGAYLWNLNTHPAYREFRSLRAQQRQDGTSLDGRALIGTMLRYSERGEAYVETIRSIMRVNRLRQFDDAQLAENVLLSDNGEVELTY